VIATQSTNLRHGNFSVNIEILSIIGPYHSKCNFRPIDYYLMVSGYSIERGLIIGWFEKRLIILLQLFL
jgi:hypothetical protein